MGALVILAQGQEVGNVCLGEMQPAMFDSLKQSSIIQNYITYYHTGIQ